MKRLFFNSRATRLASCIAFITAVTAVNGAAQSQEDVLPDVTTGNTAGTALLQYSTLTASGSTISAVWVPVTVKGVTKYVNVTIPLQFASTSAGNIVVTAGTPALMLSPIPRVSSFQAGTYKGPSQIYGGDMEIIVAGPSMAVAGDTVWTFTSTGNASCIYPSNGYWYDGPVASNAIESRIKAAGIDTSTNEWSFGLLGDQDCGGWSTNSLLGFSQVGKTITIATFTTGDTDHSLPVDSIVYTKQ